MKIVLLIVGGVVTIAAAVIAYGAVYWQSSTLALIDSVHAESRWRTVNGELIATPWEGRFWNYGWRDGMRVPLEGEVAWLLPEGVQPYWRGRIESISYEFGP
jgi:hypothetical protein